MTMERRFERVREWFERAIEERPADLGAWLEAHGLDDWQVREEVLSLVRHHGAAASFLTEPLGERLPQLIADDRTLEPGQVLGQYTIVRELGRGGMGRVYLAEDARLGRRVALKVVSPELSADARHRDRLRREARAAAALTHPGICTVYTLEELDGDLVIVSEFIDGETLRREIRADRPPSAETVVRTARELAAALGHAHAHQVTHRDLKPDNVMRSRDGALKVLDFGLAVHAAETDGALTQPGTLVGTPAYMAPEQLNGARGDARSDVFAFGVLMYEYACGVHPFQAPTPLALIGRILESAPEPLERRRPDLPAGVCAAIDRCLAKTPGDRFESAAAVARALDHQGGRPRDGAMTRWWRTHQLVIVATYFLACALAWQIKEWQPGLTTAVFIVAGIAAAVSGILRGHLVFTERINGPGLAAEHRRATPVTLGMDLLLGLALLVDGGLLSSVRPLPAVLTMALGAGIVLARVVIEPATTSASFHTQA